MNINCSQVQSTNDASTVSKSSAVRKNYFKDEFIEHFVDKNKTRASLIHLGYYTRAEILNKLILKFIQFLHHQKTLKFQIISCGSGFDTTYWRLTQANLLNSDSLFIEIDFPSVIRKKISLINSSHKLKSYMGESKKLQRINQMNSNYFLLEADLSDLVLIETLLKKIEIDFNIPTLFLSECVITYMKEINSRELIKWMGEKFENVGFINYEQIHPDDGFGEIMLRHFEKLQSPLFSVSEYPDCESHIDRYRNAGFQSSRAVSEWDALVSLTTQEERRTALCLELFDELEEFHSKCVHYVVSIAGNKIASTWVDSFPFGGFHPKTSDARKSVTCQHSGCGFELYRHSSCSSRGRIFLFGGCNWQSRSSHVYKTDNINFNEVEPVEVSKDSPVQLDMVHGCVTCFEINKKSYFCVYGGRRSPNEICNKGSVVVFEELDGKLHRRLTTTEGNPAPRYRTSLAWLAQSTDEIHCWVFGGRTADLNVSLSDLWRLSIKHEGDLTYSWKKYDSEEGDRPCGRMSHSSVACPAGRAVYVVGGVSPESSLVLDDIWKWCCGSESWERVRVTGGLLPRYAHTSHLVDDKIYSVGGVNTTAGRQPGVGVIDLKNLTVVEYTMEMSVHPVLLFNHTSEVVRNEDESRIVVLGGGGNCFSFGTYLNRAVLSIKL